VKSPRSQRPPRYRCYTVPVSAIRTLHLLHLRRGGPRPVRRYWRQGARRAAARYAWPQIAEEIYGIYCGLVHCEHRLPTPTAAAS